METLYPKTMTEFQECFKTEDACKDYLFNIRWSDGFVCSRCKNNSYWLTDKGLYRCTKCDYHSSLTAGTIFHNTRKSLQEWFHAMWYVTNQKNGVSALGLQKVLGLGSYHTAWEWLHRLRRAMVRSGRDRISGTIEVDETYIGGKHKGKQGRGSENKALVLVAAQKDSNRIGRIRLMSIPDASGDSIEKALIEMVESGSTIHTDGWTGYSNLERHGYQHVVIRGEAYVGENLLPMTHRVISLLKRWILGTHQGGVQHSHLSYYLDEYTFRFNRRTSKYRGMLFYRLIQQAVAIEPITKNELKAKIN